MLIGTTFSREMREIKNMEPTEYFNDLKSKISTIDEDKLKANLATVNDIIVNAKNLEQTSLLARLVFTRDVVAREQKALAAGIDKFIYREDILKFIEHVQPKNSVKLIELHRYPRVIPFENAEHIKLAKSLEVFDEFIVAFTDFTDKDYKTAEEKEVVARNRDPIVFGAFKLNKERMIHDRLYFITDWEDEYCDLTFTKMVDKMTNEMRLVDPVKRIGADVDYVNRIVADVKTNNPAFKEVVSSSDLEELE